VQRRLRAAGLRVQELQTLWDVDRPQDPARLQSLHEAAGGMRHPACNAC
jgi:glycosyltransferase A (GT-A) superfamily protein (DUF2064 family)